MSKRVKIFAFIVLGIAALIWISGQFGGGSEIDPNNPLETTAELTPLTLTPDAQSNEFSSLLSAITSINIDTSILSSPAYKALRDNPIAVGTDTIGRTNPFAPIGSDASTDLSTPTVQTLQPGKVTGTTAEFSAQVTFTTTAPVSVIFNYGVGDQFGSITAPVTLTSSGTAVVTVRDLMPNTTYLVQAVAVVGSTTSTGNTMNFITTQ